MGEFSCISLVFHQYFAEKLTFRNLSLGFSAQKLRVNLKLAINRLKLLEKKKSLYFILFVFYLICVLLLV